MLAADLRGQLDRGTIRAGRGSRPSNTSAVSAADMPEAAAQHVPRLGDELHVAVLDAVVDHLDEVARRRRRPTCVTHGPASVLRGDRLEHVLDARPTTLVRARPASSTARTAPLPRRPTRRSRRSGCRRPPAPPRAGAVSSNHELPPSIRMSPASSTGRSFVDRLIDRLARRDHHQDPPRPLERRGQLFEGLGARRTPAPGCVAQKVVDPLRLEIPDRDRHAARLDVQREVAAHRAEADDAESGVAHDSTDLRRRRARTHDRASGCEAPRRAAPPGSRRRATRPATSPA